MIKFLSMEEKLLREQKKADREQSDRNYRTVRIEQNRKNKERIQAEYPDCNTRYKDQQFDAQGNPCPIYKAYYLMRENEKKKSYIHQLPVMVIPEWMHNYDIFHEWSVKERENDLSGTDWHFVRIDPTLPYSPKNCRWVRDREYKINVEHSYFVCRGIMLSGKRWAELLNIHYPFPWMFKRFCATSTTRCSRRARPGRRSGRSATTA